MANIYCGVCPAPHVISTCTLSQVCSFLSGSYCTILRFACFFNKMMSNVA